MRHHRLLFLFLVDGVLAQPRAVFLDFQSLATRFPSGDIVVVTSLFTDEVYGFRLLFALGHFEGSSVNDLAGGFDLKPALLTSFDCTAKACCRDRSKPGFFCPRWPGRKRMAGGWSAHVSLPAKMSKESVKEK